MRIFLSAILLLGLLADNSAAEWQIAEVRAAPYESPSKNSPAEIRLDITIRNISETRLFVWGEDFRNGRYFYMVESFIQDQENAVWRRRNDSMCGAIGRIGWIEVGPGETFNSGQRLPQEYARRQMILTFRRAFSELDARGSEILLGPFIIPEPTESEQIDDGNSVKPAGDERTP